MYTFCLSKKILSLYLAFYNLLIISFISSSTFIILSSISKFVTSSASRHIADPTHAFFMTRQTGLYILLLIFDRASYLLLIDFLHILLSFLHFYLPCLHSSYGTKNFLPVAYVSQYFSYLYSLFSIKYFSPIFW